jgi:hypothetical protein
LSQEEWHSKDTQMSNDDAIQLANAPGHERAAQDDHSADEGHMHQNGSAMGGIQSRSPRAAAGATLKESGDQVYYQIRIQGHLDSTWSEWFDGLAIVNLEGGVTMLEGNLVDQPALHGVLQKIRDLGLTLLSVAKVGEEGDGDGPEVSGHHRAGC